MKDIFDTLGEATLKSEKEDIFDNIISEKLDYGVSKGEQVKSSLAGASVLGAGGYGLYRLGKGAKNWWDNPQKLAAPIEEQFRLWQEQLPGAKGTRPQDLPKLIRNEAETIGNKASDAITVINRKTAQAQNLWKQRLLDFDTNVLNNNIDDMATTIQKGYPQFLKDTYQAYRSGLEGIEGYLNLKGITFDTLDLENNVIGKTIKEAIKEGVPESRLAELLKLQEEHVPKEGQIGEKPISFTQAKGYVNTVGEKLPPKAQYKLSENWGKFLENYTPKEVKAQLQVLNKEYSSFAQFREAMRGVIDRKTGIFDKKKLYNYLVDYANSKVNVSKQSVEASMKMLGEGSDLSTPIKGVKERFEQLQKLGKQRNIKTRAPLRAKIGSQERIQAIANKAKQEIDNLTVWQKKAEILVSQRAELAGKYPSRLKALKGTVESIGKSTVARGLARTLFPMMSAYPVITQARAISQNMKETEGRGTGAYGMDIYGELKPFRPQEWSPTDLYNREKYWEESLKEFLARKMGGGMI